jgi:hypothetical protein
MAQPTEALRVALAAVGRLPLRLRRQLAERLLASSGTRENTITVHLRRLPQNKQSRLAALLDKSSEDALTAAEQAELRALGNEADKTMLSNSIALARAARPELFDASGLLIRKRFRHAVGIPSISATRSTRENTRR